MRFLISLILSCSLVFANQESVSQEKTVEPPKSFAREVLQPIGMPVVKTYHDVKESPFLNMAREEATGLEAIGDFFLIPSRYLFGGKKIQQDENGLKITPEFSYDKSDGVKTIGSILALPISELLGCTFKGAALLSKKTREDYSALYQSLESQKLISKLDFYKTQGILTFHSEEKASCLGFIRPSVLPENHQIELKAFREICKLLDEHGIVYWLDCGSCLGTYRYGGMIPWDQDIDIAILSPDHENVRKILSCLDPERFQIQDWSSYKYPQSFLKLYLKETKTLIDIYHYNLDAKTQTATYFFTFKDSLMPASWKKGELAMTKPVPYKVLFPLQRATFDGIPTWVPQKLEAYLKLKYGENLSPTMIWDEKTQSYKKVKDHPYWKIVE